MDPAKPLNVADESGPDPHDNQPERDRGESSDKEVDRSMSI